MYAIPAMRRFFYAVFWNGGVVVSAPLLRKSGGTFVNWCCLLLYGVVVRKKVAWKSFLVGPEMKQFGSGRTATLPMAVAAAGAGRVGAGKLGETKGCGSFLTRVVLIICTISARLVVKTGFER